MGHGTRPRGEYGRESDVSPNRTGQWSGAALMLGGALWVASAILHAQQPIGCVGGECYQPGRSMREGSPLGGALTLVAVLLLAAGVLGLVRRIRATGRFGRIGRVGLIASAAGVLTIIVALLIQSIFFGGDFWAMPYFVIPAGLAVVVGVVLLGVAILRSGVLPRWAAALLILGTLNMLGMNEQNTQVLMAIPFGAAWAVVGYVLWSRRGGPGTASGASG